MAGLNSHGRGRNSCSNLRVIRSKLVSVGNDLTTKVLFGSSNCRLRTGQTQRQNASQ